MHVIVVSSQKGGSGKTMLTVTLGVIAQQTAGPVYLIDTDPQGTMTIWHKRREAEFPARLSNQLGIAEGLAYAAAHGARYVFIDTAAGLRDEAAEAIYAFADFVLIPIRPAYSDLWSAGETVRTLKASRRPFLFVMNFVKAHTKIAAETAVGLSHHGPIAEVMVPDRTVYNASYKTGRVGPEVDRKSGPARTEMLALWKQIQSLLPEKKQLIKREA